MLGADLNVKPTYQQVTQLTYITQILKEALRLWPPAPAYGVAPIRTKSSAENTSSRKAPSLRCMVLALHRDPSVWGPNPDAFDPENFSREAEAARPVNAWKPFGNGQRACIGRGFAMHESALALGMILQRFKLIDIHRYQMVLKETLTIKPDGFKIKVRPRADQDRGAYAGPSAGTAVASAAAPAPRARTRPGSQHAAIGALRIEPRHRRGTRDPRRRSRRGQRLCHQTRAARRLRRQAAGAGRRADLLRVV